MNKYDKMIACNRKASAEKIDLGQENHLRDGGGRREGHDPKLIAKTGLSRGSSTRIRWYGKRWTKRWSSRSG